MSIHAQKPTPPSSGQRLSEVVELMRLILDMAVEDYWECEGPWTTPLLLQSVSSTFKQVVQGEPRLWRQLHINLSKLDIVYLSFIGEWVSQIHGAAHWLRDAEIHITCKGDTAIDPLRYTQLSQLLLCIVPQCRLVDFSQVDQTFARIFSSQLQGAPRVYFHSCQTFQISFMSEPQELASSSNAALSRSRKFEVDVVHALLNRMPFLEVLHMDMMELPISSPEEAGGPHSIQALSGPHSPLIYLLHLHTFACSNLYHVDEDINEEDHSRLFNRLWAPSLSRLHIPANEASSVQEMLITSCCESRIEKLHIDGCCEVYEEDTIQLLEIVGNIKTLIVTAHHSLDEVLEPEETLSALFYAVYERPSLNFMMMNCSYGMLDEAGSFAGFDIPALYDMTVGDLQRPEEGEDEWGMISLSINFEGDKVLLYRVPAATKAQTKD